MIDEPTLFVLGAGASQPYGFPTGEKLINEIIAILDPESTNVGYQRIQERIIASLEGSTETDDERLSRMAEFRKTLVGANAPSIDEFLSSTKQKYAQIGTRAIAAVLLEKERESVSKLMQSPDPDWYSTFFHRLLTDQPENLVRNKVFVITYNYDRSLEHFLVTSFNTRRPPNVSQEKWDQMVRDTVPVHHIYGKLGGIVPYENETSPHVVPYGHPSASISPDAIKLAAGNIKIIGPDSALMQQQHVFINNEMYRARNIYVLGCAFHKANMRILRWKDLPEDTIISGTCFKLPLGRMEKVTELTDGRLNATNLRNQTCKELLENDAVFQSFFDNE